MFAYRHLVGTRDRGKMPHTSLGKVMLVCAAVLAIVGVAGGDVADSVQIAHISASSPDNGPWPRIER